MTASATTTHPYPPLNLRVTTPRLELRGATDELLEQLLPVVRAGVADAPPYPFDDPMSFYLDGPDREWTWLRGVWNGRAQVNESFWRLYFVVVADGEAVGMQDVFGTDFGTFGTVGTFSWLGPQARGKGLGKEMRQAILHLAFEGLRAREAGSEAFFDNTASNHVSEALGYTPNGTGWATRLLEPAPLHRWRLTREQWTAHRRSDITLSGVEACLPVLGITT
ncbi:GNAT family N-acetyltransferase [Kitasatospora sp. NPDC051853]|uniref:GNAT family N-acetyltransferase n=1 Tax=Kitasatospora sp. NPDC051853 TaxID=3364058 RepID=UPI0037A0334B